MLRLHIGSIGPQPRQRLDSFVELPLLDKPPRRFRDEEHGNYQENWDHVDDAQRDEVCRLVGPLGGCPVDDGTNKRPLRRGLSDEWQKQKDKVVEVGSGMTHERRAELERG